MYELTDKAVKILAKRIVKRFAKLRSVLSFDELNALSAEQTITMEVKDLYDALLEDVIEFYIIIADGAYKRCRGENLSPVDREWVIDYLELYDPITKYVFAHEVERKRARLTEALIADSKSVGSDKNKDIDSAKKYWSAMVDQYAIDITDKATIQALIDDGEELAEWVAVMDERTCEECDARHGKVYPLRAFPPKPHWGCRCEMKRIGKGRI